MVESGRKWHKVVELMFIGLYNHTLDAKNRIIIPAKFRERLGPNAVITIGNDGCLSIYTAQEWEKLFQQLSQMNSNSSATRKHVRMLAGSASECEFDNRGRVGLPQHLIQLCNLNKEVVIVGNLTHIEIWSKERWEEYYSDAMADFDANAESLPRD